MFSSAIFNFDNDTEHDMANYELIIANFVCTFSGKRESATSRKSGPFIPVAIFSLYVSAKRGLIMVLELEKWLVRDHNISLVPVCPSTM